MRAGAKGFARVIANAVWWRMVASFTKEGAGINRCQCPLPGFSGLNPQLHWPRSVAPGAIDYLEDLGYRFVKNGWVWRAVK